MKDLDTNGMEPIVAHIKNLLKEQEEKREYEYEPQIEAMREMALDNLNLFKGLTELVGQAGELQGKVRILEGKALDAEQDLALNKLGDMSLPTHICYEDNQGQCHNGCNRIFNTDSCRAYYGSEGYITVLEKRMWELEAKLREKNGDE